jgi:hypothetical protein
VAQLALTPRLETIEGLFRKLQREQHRAFHHPDMTHKADHFLNFCTTAHSLRDYLLERLGNVSDRDRQPYHDAWSKNPLIHAVAEIANSAKHFQLRFRKTGAPRAPATRRVRRGRASVVHVFSNDMGELKVEKQTNVPTYYVHLSDGTSHELYSFMSAVEQHWSAELRGHGIRPRRQPFERLSGAT